VNKDMGEERTWDGHEQDANLIAVIEGWCLDHDLTGICEVSLLRW